MIKTHKHIPVQYGTAAASCREARPAFQTSPAVEQLAGVTRLKDTRDELTERRKAGEQKAEELADQAFSLSKLPKEAVKEVRSKAEILAKIKSGIRQWETETNRYQHAIDHGIEWPSKRYMNREQFDVLESMNSGVPANEKIILGIEGRGKDRRLVIYSAPEEALDELQNLIATAYEEKGRGGASGWPDDLCARPGTEERDDQDDAVTRYRREVLVHQKDAMEKVKSGLRGPAIAAVLDELKNRPCTISEKDDGTPAHTEPWGNLYPLAYLRILREAITQDRSLIRRAESGKVDGDAFDEAGFEKFIIDSLINSFEHTDVLSHLSPEWIQSHPDHFLRIATAAVKVDPEAIKLINFDLLPEDAYETILSGTIELTEDIPPESIEEPVTATPTDTTDTPTSTTSVTPTADAPDAPDVPLPTVPPPSTLPPPGSSPDEPKLKLGGKTAKDIARMDRALFAAPIDIVQRKNVAGEHPNRDPYAKRFFAVASNETSKALADLTKQNRALLDGYTGEFPINGAYVPLIIDSEEEKQFKIRSKFEKLGWAYMIADVAKANPESLMHLSDAMVAEIKALPQKIYAEIITASVQHLPSAIRIGGTEVFKVIVGNKEHTTNLAIGLQNHPEHIALIPQLLIDRDLKDAIINMITGDIKGCEYENIALLEQSPLGAWRSDFDTVAKLAQKNKSVIRVIDPALKTLTNDEVRNEPVLQLLYVALRQEKGTLNWDTDVPHATWEHIAERIKDADPEYGEFLPYMLDPKNYVNLPDVSKLFSIIDSIPPESQTAKALLGNEAIMRSIKTYPQFYSRITNTDTRSNIDFIAAVTAMNPDILRYVEPEDVKSADFEQFLSYVHTDLRKKGDIAKNFNLRAHFDHQGRTEAEYWPLIMACAKDTDVLKHLPKEEIASLTIDDLRQLLDPSLSAARREILWNRIEPAHMLNLYLAAKPEEQQQILQELGEVRTRAMFQSAAFGPLPPETGSEEKALQPTVTTTTTGTAEITGSTGSVTSSGTPPAAPAAAPGEQPAIAIPEDAVVTAALNYRDLFTGDTVLDGYITPAILEKIWEGAAKLQQEGKASINTPTPEFLLTYFPAKIRALQKEKERIAAVMKKSAREVQIMSNVDISSLEGAYKQLVYEYATKSPEHAQYLQSAGEFFRNDAPQFTGMLKDFYRDVKVDHTVPMTEEAYDAIEQNILKAATDEVLLALMKDATDKERPYWYLCQIDKIGRLQNILRAEDAKGDKTLFENFVSRGWAEKMLSCATRAHLLSDKDFMVKMFQGANKDQERYVMECAADNVLYAILSQPNPDIAMQAAMDKTRIRTLVSQAGAAENGMFFVNLIRLTEDPSLLTFSNQEAVANDPDVIKRLLESKDPAKKSDKEYIRALLAIIPIDRLRDLLDPAKQGEERASAFDALAPALRDINETIVARTEEINQMKDEEAKKKAIERQQNEFVTNLDLCQPKMIEARANDFQHLHEESRKDSAFVLRAMESIQKRVVTEGEHKEAILAILLSAGNAVAVDALGKLNMKVAEQKQILHSLRLTTGFVRLLDSAEGRASTPFYLKALEVGGVSVLNHLRSGDPVTKDQTFADGAENLIVGAAGLDENIRPLLAILDTDVLATKIINGKKQEINKEYVKWMPRNDRTRLIALYERVQRVAPKKATALARELVKRDGSLTDILPAGATVSAAELKEVLGSATKTSREKITILSETQGVLPVLIELMSEEKPDPEYAKLVLSDTLLTMKVLGYIQATPNEESKKALTELFKQSNEDIRPMMLAGIPREFGSNKEFFDGIDFMNLERTSQMLLLLKMSPSCIYKFVQEEATKIAEEQDETFLRSIIFLRGEDVLGEMEDVTEQGQKDFILQFVKHRKEPVFALGVDRSLYEDVPFLTDYLNAPQNAVGAEAVVKDILEHTNLAFINNADLLALLLSKTTLYEEQIIQSMSDATFVEVLKIAPFVYWFATAKQRAYAISKAPAAIESAKDFAILERKFSVPKKGIDTIMERYYLLSAFPTEPDWTLYLKIQLDAINTFLANRSGNYLIQVNKIVEDTLKEMESMPNTASIRDYVKNKDYSSPPKNVDYLEIRTITPPGRYDSLRLSYVSPKPDMQHFNALRMQWTLEKGKDLTENDINSFKTEIVAMFAELGKTETTEKDRTEALSFLASFKSALNRNPAATNILEANIAEGSLMAEVLDFMEDPIFLQALDANGIEQPEALMQGATITCPRERVRVYRRVFGVFGLLRRRR